MGVGSSKQGDSKDFKVGKEIRQALYKLCVHLMKLNKNLIVQHISYGDSCHWIMNVTTKSKLETALVLPPDNVLSQLVYKEK